MTLPRYMPDQAPVLRELLDELGFQVCEDIHSPTCLLAWSGAYRCWFERELAPGEYPRQTRQKRGGLWRVRVYGAPVHALIDDYLATSADLLSLNMRLVEFRERKVPSGLGD